jgi:hypothetical protein
LSPHARGARAAWNFLENSPHAASADLLLSPDRMAHRIGSRLLSAPCGSGSISFVLVVGFLHVAAATVTGADADLIVLPCASTASALPPPSVPDDSIATSRRCCARHVSRAVPLHRGGVEAVADAVDPRQDRQGAHGDPPTGDLVAQVQLSVRTDPVEWTPTRSSTSSSS